MGFSRQLDVLIAALAALVVFVAGLCGYGPLEMGGIFAGSEDTV